MYWTRFRIRTLMIAVAVIAPICWAGLAWWDWYRRNQPVDPFDALEMVPVSSGWAREPLDHRLAERSSKPTHGSHGHSNTCQDDNDGVEGLQGDHLVERLRVGQAAPRCGARLPGGG